MEIRHPGTMAPCRSRAAGKKCAPGDLTVDVREIRKPGGVVGVRARGFTITELLVVIGLVAVLVGLLLPVLNKARSSSQSVTCLANLRHITLAFNLYAGANRQQFPLPSDVSRQSWESVLRTYLDAREVYHCPSDGGVFERYGSSYDWRDTGDPNTTAAGKYLPELGRSNVVFTFDALPDWHATGRVNAATLDGSATSMRYQDCLRDLDLPIGK